MGYNGLCLDYVGHGRRGQLHGEMYGLVDCLPVAGRDGHLNGDGLLHGELDDLWNRSRSNGHALAVGELHGLKVLKVRRQDAGGTDYLAGAEDLLGLLGAGG